MKAAKYLLLVGIGYMLKSLLISLGPTSENLSVNLVLLISSVVALVVIEKSKDSDQ